MHTELLDILCCPLTHQPLEYLDQSRLDRLNAAIITGKALNRAEQTVTATLQQALITRDSRLVYPIRDGIPVLLEEESIDWARLSD